MIEEDWSKQLIDCRLIKSTWKIVEVSIYKTYTNLTNQSSINSNLSSQSTIILIIVSISKQLRSWMLVIANQLSKSFKTRRREENITYSFSLSSAPTQKQRNETKRRLEIKNGPHLCFLTDDRDQLKKKKRKQWPVAET